MRRYLIAFSTLAAIVFGFFSFDHFALSFPRSAVENNIQLKTVLSDPMVSLVSSSSVRTEIGSANAVVTKLGRQRGELPITELPTFTDEVSVENLPAVYENYDNNIPRPVALGYAAYPKTIYIPSIRLNSPVQGMGLTALGALDVPNGKTNDVGWYKGGTVPGQIGSAVLDAHVFAAFANLNKIKTGDQIYIYTETGQKLRFIVEESVLYPLSDVPADKLFNRNDAARLNLITCAGKLTPDHKTYDHRLIIYAKLSS